MLTLRISHDIRLPVKELAPRAWHAIKQDLAIDPNPAYMAAVRQNRSTWGIPRVIELYQLAEDGTLTLPRGYGKRLEQVLRSFRVEYGGVDNRLQLQSVDFGSRIVLRDYQAPAVEALVTNRQGGLVAPCGSGKTSMMLDAMARIGQPALWTCHTHELLEQTRERAIAAFDIPAKEIGIIAGGKVRIGDRLTLALIQTLAKADIEELAEHFGAIFVDEAHHLAARTFFDTVGQFPALYRLWASATPERSDGLTGLVFAAGGPILHTVDRSQVPTVTPRLVVIDTDYAGVNVSDDYVALIGDLVRDEDRNRLIVRTIAAEAAGHYSLVLSERIEHLQLLQEMLFSAAPGVATAVLTGTMGKLARADVMRRVRAAGVDVLLATQLAREGLDITHLDRLFLATPKRAAGTVQQEVGRIMRPCEGKTDAVVFDFVDVGSSILKTQYYKRRKVYREIGIDTEGGDGRIGRRGDRPGRAGGDLLDWVQAGADGEGTEVVMDERRRAGF